MKKIYTVISYIEGEQGWHDRCGDYHSGKESILEINYFDDPIKAAHELGKAQFNNASGQNNLLINGLDVNEYHDFLSEEEQKKLQEDYDEVDDLAFKVREEMNAEARKKIEEEKQRKIQEENMKQLREKKRVEEAERAQLAKLLNKYKN